MSSHGKPNPIEKFGFVFFAGGFGLFGFSVFAQAILPLVVLKNIPMATVEDIAENVDPAFEDMARRWKPEFDAAFPDGPTSKSYAEALRIGRKVYVQEACWHCHSQFVRPISNEAARWGKVSYASEYQTELQMPPLLGTRRVGPDLSREAWVHSNDWHAAHFYKPKNVVPVSVMPDFPWLFDEKTKNPNKKGLSLIAYVQYLGSWVPEEERAPVGEPNPSGLRPNTLSISTEEMDAAAKSNPIKSEAPAPKASASAAVAAPTAAPVEAAAPVPAPVQESLDDIPIKKDAWATEDKLDKSWVVGIE